jgi:hypothetical protein
MTQNRLRTHIALAVRSLVAPAAILLTVSMTPSLASSAPLQAKGQTKVPKDDVPVQKGAAAVQKGAGVAPKQKGVVDDGHGHGPGDGHDHGKQTIKETAGDLKGRYGGSVNPNAKLGIEFGTEKHNFGRVRQGQILNHVFTIESAGTEPLEIRQAKPTCGCTVGSVAVENDAGEMAAYKMGDPIPPGRKIAITGTMDTANKRNKADVRINVYTNDPVGLTQLGLSAIVEPFMTATPQFLNLGELAEDTTKVEYIDIRTTKGETVKLEFDTSRSKRKPQGVEVELEAQDPDASGASRFWRAKVTIGPGLKEGPVGYGFHVVSDEPVVGGKSKEDGSLPMYSVNATMNGRVLGVLSCSPQYLSMGLVKPSQVVSRTVRVTSNDPVFELDGVEVELRGAKGPDGQPLEFAWAEHFQTVLRPVAGKNAVEVELTLAGLPEGSDGSFKGQMVIHTGNETKPEMVVNFSGVCRAGLSRTAVQKPKSQKVKGK